MSPDYDEPLHILPLTSRNSSKRQMPGCSDAGVIATIPRQYRTARHVDSAAIDQLRA
jgi:hypothetical protein